MTNAPSTQNLLDAMDGITLLLDGELRIAAVGWPNWNAFLRGNEGPSYAPADILGKSIDGFFTVGEVRETYRRVFRKVLEGRKGELQVTYRCDAPDVQRLMRLSVTRLDGSGGARLLYQSVLLDALQRPPIGLFGVPVRSSGEEDLLTICSLCARVAWPKGVSEEEREWVEPPEYYRRGGEEVAELSHGFCKNCFGRLMAELD